MNKSTVDAITVNGISKRYDDLQALSKIDFEIPQGEFFGLLGPNGAGKSTLISILAGLIKPTAGNAQILGADVQIDYRLARRNLGIVPQEVVIDSFFTVRETLRFQSGYFGITNNESWINELLEQLGLADKADANMRKLSGGMKRRVLIAQALVHKPPVLVLDEPTAGVDVDLRESMWRFIRHLNSEGHTIVLTTHYLEEAEELCDRIAIIDKGQVIALESKQDLLARGLGSTLLVKAAHQIETIPNELKDRITRLDDNELELTFHRDNDSIMDILDRLRGAAMRIEYVSVLSDNLQDVFVQLTGDNREEINKAAMSVEKSHERS